MSRTILLSMGCKHVYAKKLERQAASNIFTEIGALYLKKIGNVKDNLKAKDIEITR